MDSLWKRSFVLRHHFQASEYILGSLKAKKIIPIPDRSSLSPVKINTKPYNDDTSLSYTVYTHSLTEFILAKITPMLIPTTDTDYFVDIGGGYSPDFGDNRT